MRTACHDREVGRRSPAQRGAVLVEFAITCTLFLTLVYAAIAYGVMFWVKATITHAAGEAARAAIGGVDAVATARTTAEAIIDRTLPAANAASAKPVAPTTAPCAANPAETCITVTVSYPYAAHPVVPTLPFLPGLPAQLKATSVVQLP
jgi:Flp pilus assembly protein TadG